MIAMKDIRAFADRVAELFKPEKIILFGSYAYGTPNVDSDVDMLVVMPYRGDACKKAAQICNAVICRFPLDMLVRNAKELEKRIAMNDFFIKEITENGIVLFERGSAGMDRLRGGRLHRRATVIPRKKIA
ncbi:MAG TPA: nucleotidyltransferase domain-containing protein [Planctomycetota bacterium]|nr:nucleotidyltransferase domain-containing protein [Planctomycetota bacterium]